MIQVLRALLLTILGIVVIGGGILLLRGGTTGLREPALTFFKAWWSGQRIENALAREFEGATSASAFTKLREFQRQQLGEFESAGDTVKEWSHDSAGHISIMLQFERGAGTGHFDYVRENDDWKLKFFRLDLPRSKAPKSDATDPNIFCRKLLMNWGKANGEAVWEQFTPELRARIPFAVFGKRTEAFVEAHGSPAEIVVASLDEDGEDGETVRASIELVHADTRRVAKIVLTWQGGRWYVSTFEVDDFLD